MNNDPWPGRTAPPIRPWSLDDIQVGDLLFAAKATGPLKWLGVAADEPWRHVGSVVRDPASGELRTIEVLGDRFATRSLEDFFEPDRYSDIGIARLGVDDRCTTAAHHWMRERIPEGESGETQVYAWDDLILSGLIAASHRRILRLARTEIRQAISMAATMAKPRLEYRGVESYTCSAFVYLAYEAADGPCTIEVPRWRTAVAPWLPPIERLDAIFDMTDDELSDYWDLSVLDLYVELERIDRKTGTTRIRKDHLGELLRSMLWAVCGVRADVPIPPGLGSDGRWVSPGDLWDSPSVRDRGRLRG